MVIHDPNQEYHRVPSTMQVAACWGGHRHTRFGPAGIDPGANKATKNIRWYQLVQYAASLVKLNGLNSQ